MTKDSEVRRQTCQLLRALLYDGIEEIYLDPENKASREPARTEENGADLSVKNDLLALREKVLKCAQCSELAAGRKNVVFGSGNIRTSLMFVGEAPGHDEDLQGLPFVGRAGQLLTKIIESIELKRSDVFIANVLKCRPPGNRQPRPDEILNCEPYLMRQIELIRPKIICALGTFAAQTLLKTGQPISQLRGQFHDYHGSRLICTFHPAYLLRNPSEKVKVWDDMKKIKKELAAPPGDAAGE